SVAVDFLQRPFALQLSDRIAPQLFEGGEECLALFVAQRGHQESAPLDAGFLNDVVEPLAFACRKELAVAPARLSLARDKTAVDQRADRPPRLAVVALQRGGQL